MLIIVYLTCLLQLAFGSRSEENLLDNEWTGKWFPHSPLQAVDKTDQQKSNLQDLSDQNHGIQMGITSDICDDGKTNLTVDWDGSPYEYLCLTERYSSNYSVNPYLECKLIPKAYVAPHKCMSNAIEYFDPVPTFGSHRPLWAKYGEYKYLPAQRWVHNLEHGAIVMLYHPCASRREVQQLKTLVKNCLYKHIITPSKRLSREKPLALVSWGCRLLMNVVEEKIVVDFIQQYALKGYESLNDDGQFSHLLEERAQIISDINDSRLCPRKLPMD